MSSSLHILIVDDEEIVHETIGSFLREFGHQVEFAWDGYQALDTIKAKDFDLALIDARMPGMDGLALLEKLQEVKPHLTTVMITGHGDPTMAEEALKLGVLDFLVKPVRLMDLIQLLNRINQN